MKKNILCRWKHHYLAFLLLLALPALALASCGNFLSQPHTYVALGASDAVGKGATDPKTDGYVPLLEQHLAKGSQFYDFGVSGITLGAALQQELPLALQKHPDLVTVWLAVNDLGRTPLPRYEQELNQLLTQLASTKAEIYVANIPQLMYLPRFNKLSQTQKAKRDSIIQRWNTAIAQIISQHSDYLVDLYNNLDLKDHPTDWVSADGFHPNNTGYQQIANIFWQTISSHN